MTLLYYISTVLFSAVQSVFTKKNGRDNGDIGVFQLSRALISFFVFGLILLMTGRIHVPSLPYGASYGVFLAVSMFTGYMALKNGPMGLTSAVVSLSLIIPIIYCCFVLGEKISFFGLIGLVLCAVSLILINSGKKKESKKITGAWWLYTSLTLISNGACSILQKEHGRLFASEGKADFMFFASVICTAVFLTFIIFKRNKSIQKVSIINGFCAGIGNGASGLFTLYLAARTAGGVLFPIISVTTITVSLICGKIFFREKLSKNQLLGFATAVFAVFFLQM